jgi:hypothetical protein
MRRHFERERTLRAFACDLSTLSSFIRDVIAEDFGGKADASAGVHLKGESLGFDSIDEIGTRDEVPDTVKHISILVRDSGRSTSMYLRAPTGFLSGSAYVRVEGESESFTEGLAAKVQNFARKHRTNYSFVRPWMASVLWPVCPIAASLPAFRAPWTIGLLAVLWIGLGVCFFWFGLVFPPVVLRIRDKGSSRLLDLVPLIALLTLVATVFGVIATVVGVLANAAKK